MPRKKRQKKAKHGARTRASRQKKTGPDRQAEAASFRCVRLGQAISFMKGHKSFLQQLQVDLAREEQYGQPMVCCPDNRDISIFTELRQDSFDVCAINLTFERSKSHFVMLPGPFYETLKLVNVVARRMGRNLLSRWQKRFVEKYCPGEDLSDLPPPECRAAFANIAKATMNPLRISRLRETLEARFVPLSKLGIAVRDITFSADDFELASGRMNQARKAESSRLPNLVDAETQVVTESLNNLCKGSTYFCFLSQSPAVHRAFDECPWDGDPVAGSAWPPQVHSVTRRPQDMLYSTLFHETEPGLPKRCDAVDTALDHLNAIQSQTNLNFTLKDAEVRFPSLGGTNVQIDPRGAQLGDLLDHVKRFYVPSGPERASVFQEVEELMAQDDMIRRNRMELIGASEKSSFPDPPDLGYDAAESFLGDDQSDFERCWEDVRQVNAVLGELADEWLTRPPKKRREMVTLACLLTDRMSSTRVNSRTRRWTLRDVTGDMAVQLEFYGNYFSTWFKSRKTITGVANQINRLWRAIARSKKRLALCEEIGKPAWEVIYADRCGQDHVVRMNPHGLPVEMDVLRDFGKARKCSMERMIVHTPAFDCHYELETGRTSLLSHVFEPKLFASFVSELVAQMVPKRDVERFLDSALKGLSAGGSQ